MAPKSFMKSVMKKPSAASPSVKSVMKSVMRKPSAGVTEADQPDSPPSMDPSDVEKEIELVNWSKSIVTTVMNMPPETVIMNRINATRLRYMYFPSTLGQLREIIRDTSMPLGPLGIFIDFLPHGDQKAQLVKERIQGSDECSITFKLIDTFPFDPQAVTSLDDHGLVLGEAMDELISRDLLSSLGP